MSADRFSLAGQVALVTGASSGIGYHLAKELAAAGAKVGAVARRLERCEQLVAEIEASGGSAVAAAMDITQPDSVLAAVEAVEARLGTIDTLVNNAGIGGGTRFLDLSRERHDAVMGANYGGTWNVTREVVGRMVAGGVKGSVVNIASILGLGAQPAQTDYAAAKGAVVQFTRALALDLARHGIRVNAVAPGYFVTDLNREYLASRRGQEFLARTPARRAGALDELAGPVLLLASPAGSFINGAVLPVDGAHSAALIW